MKQTKNKRLVYITLIKSLDGSGLPSFFRCITVRLYKGHVSLEVVLFYIHQPIDEMTAHFVPTMYGFFVTDSIKEFNQFVFSIPNVMWELSRWADYGNPSKKAHCFSCGSSQMNQWALYFKALK